MLNSPDRGPHSTSRLSPLAIIIGSKGGVGKSAVAEAVILAMRNAGILVGAYDADSSISSVYQKLATRGEDGKFIKEQDPLVGAARFNFRSQSEADAIIMIKEGAQLNVIDTPGGSMLDFFNLLGTEKTKGYDQFMDLMRESGHEPVFIHPITGEDANILSEKSVLDAFPDARQVAVVMRSFLSGPADLNRWNNSATRELLLQRGGKEISMPALHAEVFATLKSSHYPLMAAPAGAPLHIMHGRRLKIWQDEFRAELAEIEDWLR